MVWRLGGLVVCFSADPGFPTATFFPKLDNLGKQLRAFALESRSYTCVVDLELQRFVRMAVSGRYLFTRVGPGHSAAVAGFDHHRSFTGAWRNGCLRNRRQANEPIPAVQADFVASVGFMISERRPLDGADFGAYCSTADFSRHRAYPGVPSPPHR